MKRTALFFFFASIASAQLAVFDAAQAVSVGQQISQGGTMISTQASTLTNVINTLKLAQSQIIPYTGMAGRWMARLNPWQLNQALNTFGLNGALVGTLNGGGSAYGSFPQTVSPINTSIAGVPQAMIPNIQREVSMAQMHDGNIMQSMSLIGASAGGNQDYMTRVRNLITASVSSAGSDNSLASLMNKVNNAGMLQTEGMSVANETSKNQLQLDAERTAVMREQQTRDVNGRILFYQNAPASFAANNAGLSSSYKQMLTFPH